MEKKIVILLNDHFRRQIFAPKDFARFEKLGKVICNLDLTGPTPQRVKELIPGATAVITSWGSPALDKEILDLAPNLQVVLMQLAA